MTRALLLPSRSKKSRESRWPSLCTGRAELVEKLNHITPSPDSKGNTYSLAADITNVSNVRTVILAAHNVTALVSGDTITVTHPSASVRALSANEFSGLSPTSALDQTHTATGSSTAPSSGATAATSEAAELLLGAMGVAGP